jgi:PIN domain nuclease of toxin-antitoxin system
VNYLLDTGVWLISALQPEAIPEKNRDLIGDARETFGLSIFSLWEVAKKHQIGKLPLPMELTSWFKAALPAQVRVLPLTQDIIVDSTRLPDFPVNDPADQLIVATARIHQLTLITTDTRLKSYRAARILHFTLQP